MLDEQDEDRVLAEVARVSEIVHDLRGLLAAATAVAPRESSASQTRLVAEGLPPDLTFGLPA